MATLQTLKQALRHKADATESTLKQHLSDEQYSASLDIFVEEPASSAYSNFIVPQLSRSIEALLASRAHLSVLEVGPGPKSVLGGLPDRIRRNITSYTAFEPNELFATRLKTLLGSGSQSDSPLPCLEKPPIIHRTQFAPDAKTIYDDDKYDIILFCHSMYGMKSKRNYIERALKLLVEGPKGGIVVVFHRDGALNLDGLVCNRTASFPTGTVHVADEEEVLDSFAAFVAGFTCEDDLIKAVWREACRAMGQTKDDVLLFSGTEVMASFTSDATKLPELTALVPLLEGDVTIKNREARLHSYAAVVKPTELQHVQHCVQWALKYGFGLNVIGGGHSDHCLWQSVVSVDMNAFDRIHIHSAGSESKAPAADDHPLVVVGSGCKTGDIIRTTMVAGLTVPLGSRPSVGAGLWLQGGIGHLARLFGLSCDAMVGAIVVDVQTGRILCVGNVPGRYCPTDAVRPENEVDWLWALRGAGTNFGIVVSVSFKAFPAPTYSTRDWLVPLHDLSEAQAKFSEFDKTTAKWFGPRHRFSADAYVFAEASQLHLCVTASEASIACPANPSTMPAPVPQSWGLGEKYNVMDGVQLFDGELYMSNMHGGHSGGRTTSFKRCVFLKDIGEADVVNRLVKAVHARPTPLCYLHLLNGGGAMSKVEESTTAFGWRDWHFACVITGTWPRDQDGTAIARSAISWVYQVAQDLLPLSCGVYSADLGPDPRDMFLANKAFGPDRTRRRLVKLKQECDPHNILAYACPILEPPTATQLIVIVTGKHSVGKDFCAEAWAAALNDKGTTARVISISEVTKQEYAAATGADLSRLLGDRVYKEQHRPALTAFLDQQVQQDPQLLEKHFQKVVDSASDEVVLIVTGMRDEAPVATYSHTLLPTRVVEVSVRASEHTRRLRQGIADEVGEQKGDEHNDDPRSLLAYCPDFVYENESNGA